jgi:hypothetical protein
LWKRLASTDSSRKIGEFDEKVKTHPILVNAFPQLNFFGEANAPACLVFTNKRRSDFFNHELVSAAAC